MSELLNIKLKLNVKETHRPTSYWTNSKYADNTHSFVLYCLQFAFKFSVQAWIPSWTDTIEMWSKGSYAFLDTAIDIYFFL